MSEWSVVYECRVRVSCTSAWILLLTIDRAVALMTYFDVCCTPVNYYYKRASLFRCAAVECVGKLFTFRESRTVKSGGAFVENDDWQWRFSGYMFRDDDDDDDLTFQATIYEQANFTDLEMTAKSGRWWVMRLNWASD